MAVFNALGQSCALGVNSNTDPPMLKKRLWRFENPSLEMLRSPTLLSIVAPVRDVYVSNASVAINRRVVPWTNEHETYDRWEKLRRNTCVDYTRGCGQNSLARGSISNTLIDSEEGRRRRS